MNDIPVIKIFDMPMGTGKTTGIIEFMNQHPENQYLYISLYCSERERIQQACPELNFCIPDDQYSKLQECNKFIQQGKNIATTHALFEHFDDNTKQLLKQHKYVLIIDEEPEFCLSTSVMPVEDLQMFVNQGYCTITETQNKLVQNPEKMYNGGNAIYKRLYELDPKYDSYLSGDLGRASQSIGVIHVMKPEILGYFQEVYLLTYLFENCLFAYYCKIFKINWTYYHFADDEILKEKFDDTLFRQSTKEKIKIYNGKLNFCQTLGENARGNMSLSKSFYESASRAYKKRIIDNANNFIRNIAHGRQKDTMWSVFKNQKDIIKGGGCYSKSFVSCNCRATNEYRNKRVLAYLLNIYMPPYLVHWLAHHQIQVDQEHFALTMLLQWVYRSRIRDGANIELYLPSARMRQILEKYLTHQI